MKQKLYIVLMLAVATLAGCSKVEVSTNLPSPYPAGKSPISFGSVSAATKGIICDSEVNPLDTMEINAYYTKQALWADIADVEQFMWQQFTSKSGDKWTYSPLKYWPNNTGDKVSFFATSPIGEIDCTNDDATGKPRFTYKANPFAEFNDDLMIGSVLNATKDVDGVMFDMKHILTRINIEVAAINALTVDEDGQTLYTDGQGTGEYDVEYDVNGITFNDIMLNGEVVVDPEDGTFEWAVDQTSKLYITATQGKTLKSHDDAPLTTTSVAQTAANNYIYNAVCRQNDAGEQVHAIFVMPQEIENNSYGTTPTVQLRIRKHYSYYSTVYDEETQIGSRVNAAGETEYKYRGEVIYVPDAVTLPTPKQEGWKMGENLKMRFIFDLSADNPTPLTVLSMIYDYTDVDIDINVNRNIYIYSDKNDVVELASDQTEAKMNFYTNYSRDLTEYQEHEELDGTTTTSHGFVFSKEAFDSNDHSHWTPVATGETDSEGYAKYKVTSTDDSSYYFYYWLKKSTREDEGCYVGTDATGVNKRGKDAVYLLRLVIDDSHLIPCDQTGNTRIMTGGYGTVGGNIAAEMLSDAGGMITKVFPIKVIKKMN